MCITGGLIMGETALLGAIPIEDMDLSYSPGATKTYCQPRKS